MEYLNDVLIKEANGPDKVFIVDNLPKELIYRKAKRLVFIPRHAVDYDPHFPKVVDAYELRDEDMPDEPRNRRVTHEMADELLPGIEASQTNDGGFVFFTELNEAKARLEAIDSYIARMLGPLAPKPERVEYSSVKGSFMAPPKLREQLPRVSLPGPVSPPSKDVQGQEGTELSTSTLSYAAYKQKTDNLAKAREARQMKQKEARLAAQAEKDAVKGKGIE